MRKVNEMTLREKVGQLFMIRPDALEKRFDTVQIEDVDLPGTTCVTEEMRALYREYPCGGFALFRKNLIDPAQLLSFTKELHGLGDPPPMLSIDEEGGRVARIANHPVDFGVPRFPPMNDIGQTHDESYAHRAGFEIGSYLKRFGLNIDLAPVADVNTHPDNCVKSDRSFGSDPEEAARMIRQYVRGLHEAGVASCVKHFPGSGNTNKDTHLGYAETLKTWEDMKACEMIPFAAGIAEGTEYIMAGHIAAPEVTGNEVPSTLSPVILTEKLRGEMGFDGLIMTDALGMKAVSEKYTSAEACVESFLAGADVLLMPADYFEAFDGMMKAVEDGRISEERIHRSVERILAFKQTMV